MRKLLLVLQFLLINLSIHAYSGPTIVGPEMEGWIQKDGGGFFLEVFQEAAKAAKLEFRYKLLPYARAVKQYKLRNFQCYLGGDQKSVSLAFGVNVKVLESEEIHREDVHVYTLKDQEKISKISQLDELRIGILLGNPLEILGLKKTYRITELQKLDKLIPMLKLGRIDAIVEYSDFPKLVKGQVHYDPSLILNSVTHRVHCHQSQEAELFLKQLDEGIRSLKSQGKIREIYKKHFP